MEIHGEHFALAIVTMVFAWVARLRPPTRMWTPHIVPELHYNCQMLNPAQTIKIKQGAGLEAAVARIQQMLDPGSRVSRNDRIRDRLGNLREFDVVIRGKLGGRIMLGVVECKDRGIKLGTPHVEAFLAKARNINANLVLMVSKKGFTRPALALAKHEGIGTLSLLPNDVNVGSISVGWTMYAEIWTWVKASIQVIPDPGPLAGRFDYHAITHDHLPVLNWWFRELATTHGKHTTPGWMNVSVRFDRPRLLSINGRPHEATELVFSALRTVERKKKFCRIAGDGLIDWQTRQVTIPGGGQLRTDAFSLDITNWPTHAGEIPCFGEGDAALFKFVAFSTPPIPEDVPDLMIL